MLFKKQTASTRYNIFYLFKIGKEPKPFPIAVLILPTLQKRDLVKPERRAAVTNPAVGRREGRVPVGSPSTRGRAAPSRQGVTMTHLLFTARYPGLRPQQEQLLRDCSYTWSSTCQEQYFFTSTYFCTFDFACLIFRVNPHNSK